MAKKKMMVKKMGSACCQVGNHMNCWAMSVLILGVLILLNALWMWVSWGVFVGGVVILKALWMMIHKKMCCRC